MTWSFSRVSSFENCALAWKLNYIECADRENNFFAEFGLLVHAALEKYFRDELEVYELAQWYQNNYDKFVKTPVPPFPPNMEEGYFKSGLNYFENFDFPKHEYEVLGIEDSFDVKIGDYTVVIKPDLFLRHKNTKKNILCDYKSSVLFKPTSSNKNVIYLSKGQREYPYTFKNKDKREQLVHYVRQMYLYCYGLKQYYNIDINEIQLWFVRHNKTLLFPYRTEKSKESIDWFIEEISLIEKEEDWQPITFGLDEKQLKKVSYWCNFLCSFRSICDCKAPIGD